MENAKLFILANPKVKKKLKIKILIQLNPNIKMIAESKNYPKSAYATGTTV